MGSNFFLSFTILRMIDKEPLTNGNTFIDSQTNWISLSIMGPRAQCFL